LYQSFGNAVFALFWVRVIYLLWLA